MKLGGALALLGLLLWAASYSEWGLWFLIPACIFGGMSILLFIVYVIVTDGRERDVHRVQEATFKGYGRDFHVPHVPEAYDKRKFDHSPYNPSWRERLWLAFRRWIGRPQKARSH